MTFWIFLIFLQNCENSISLPLGTYTDTDIENASTLGNTAFGNATENVEDQFPFDAKKNFAQDFWEPSVTSTKSPLRFFRIQSSPQRKSTLIDRMPQLFDRLVGTVVQLTDFSQVSTESVLDLQAENIILEENPANPLKVDQNLLEYWIENHLGNSGQTISPRRERIGNLIYSEFSKSGLMMLSEIFDYYGVTLSSTDPSRKKAQQPYRQKFQGVNIVGVIPGRHWSTTEDRPLVIGAHWDSFNETSGLNDNGSGILALLETSRILTKRELECFKPDYSIIFIAFDGEERGCRGSQNFVTSYVRPLANHGVNIQGAIIADTIFNYDATPNTQMISQAWKIYAPDASKAIMDNKNRGDFLSIFSRDGSMVDKHLENAYRKNYESVSRFPDYIDHKILPVHVKNLGDQVPDYDTLANVSDFWMSDHSRFWYHLEKNETEVESQQLEEIENVEEFSFGAILLTDTAYFRGYMRRCYHQSCDDVSAVDKESFKKNLKFLDQTIQALVLTCLDLTTESSQCEKEKHALLQENSEEVASPIVETDVEEFEGVSEIDISPNRNPLAHLNEVQDNVAKQIVDQIQNNKYLIEELIQEMKHMSTNLGQGRKTGAKIQQSFGGNQINVENLYFNSQPNIEPVDTKNDADTFLFLDGKPKRSYSREEDNLQSLTSLISKLMKNTSDTTGFETSPMLIKLLKNEL